MADNSSISNLSYTNKDFNAIYVELLDLVKKLTYKWDPTVSNESDPGVLLLKLMAICADKNNYTADKAVLECFPESVTQEQNARKLFEQLGYTMHWYRAGSTNISVRWAGDMPSDGEDVIAYEIPRFTMVSDEDGASVYTLTNRVNITTDRAPHNVSALQGVVEKYLINGSNLITVANLDSDNRIYLADRNVAENGIFIANFAGGKGVENYDEWKPVENLAVEKLGQRVYKFGVSADGTQCYIEFPDDVDDLFGEGISITYIKTDGEDGNVASRVMERLYNDVPLYDDEGKKSITLNASNVALTNLSSVRDGYNPETIEEAFKNYKKTIGTFNTLVTIRDYENAVNRSDLVSNAFVCDRTNDIQSSYNVVTREDAVNKRVLNVTESNGAPEMNAFNLKLYMLQQVIRPSTLKEFTSSFDIVKNAKLNSGYVDKSQTVNNVIRYLDEQKSVQHDFIEHIADENRPVMFKNKYTVTCRIIPQYKVTDLQEKEITENVHKALYDSLNAHKMTFGDEVSYDAVYDVIMNADERIRAITLDDLDLITYAVVYNSETLSYEEVKVNDFSDGMSEIQKSIFAKSVLNGNTQILVKDGVFAYGYDQADGIAIDKVESVTTEANVSIPLNTDDYSVHGTYILNDNESLYFYAPNLIDDTNYSTYVKYQYSGNEIASDADYALRSGEVVVFYWKDSDSDADYNYRKYTEGTIIHPSFTLTATAGSVATLPNDSGTTRGIMYGEGTLTEYLSGLTADTLSASRTVTVKKKNETKLDNATQKCCWYLNSKSDGKFRLFESTNGATTQTRVLQYGEYFMYTNANGTELAILGAGTKITRVSESAMPEMVCDIIDIDKVQSDGAESLKDFWMTLPSSVAVTATEMRIVSLGNGVVLNVQAVKGYQPSMLIIRNDGAYEVEPGGGDPVKLDNLNHYEYIRYTTPDGKDTYLPQVNLGNDGWNVMSSLALNMSHTKPQRLLSNQKITFHKADGTDAGVTGNNESPKCILADYAYDLVGGEDVDVRRMLADGSAENANFYYSIPSPAVSDDDVVFGDDGTIDIDVTTDEASEGKIVEFKIPNGEYIIRLKHDNADISELKVAFADTKDPTMPEGSDQRYYNYLLDIRGVEDISDAGEYLLRMNVSPTTGEHESPAEIYAIKITYSGNSNIRLTLSRPYKYTKPSVISDTDFTDVMAKIKELDTKHKFDYLYSVNPDEEIVNPLSAEAFMDKNHIYNKYTICQMETVATKVTNKIK